jgi:hypothetical protein
MIAQPQPAGPGAWSLESGADDYGHIVELDSLVADRLPVTPTPSVEWLGSLEREAGAIPARPPPL